MYCSDTAMVKNFGACSAAIVIRVPESYNYMAIRLYPIPSIDVAQNLDGETHPLMESAMIIMRGMVMDDFGDLVCKND